MEEKTYLKWYNKIGYGSGDIAGNVVYAFLTSFVMVYLTLISGSTTAMIGMSWGSTHTNLRLRSTSVIT